MRGSERPDPEYPGTVYYLEPGTGRRVGFTEGATMRCLHRDCECHTEGGRRHSGRDLYLMGDPDTMKWDEEKGRFV